MKYFNGREIRGKLISKDTIKTPDGDIRPLEFSVDPDYLDEDIVIRDNTVTRRIDS